MDAVKFEDYTIKVEIAMDDVIAKWLEEAAGEIESQVKRTVPVDMGELKSSWRHEVHEADKNAVIGSDIENAVWNEFGTGQYALNGGRKTPWSYRDRQGQWHKTRGKKPNRSLHNAFESKKSKVKTRFEKLLQEGMK